MLLSLTFFLARAGGGVGGGGHSSSGGGFSGGSHFSSGGTHTFVGGGGSGFSGGTTSGGGWIGALFIVPVIIIVLVLIYAAHRRTRAAVTRWPSSTAPGSPTPTSSWPVPNPPDEMAQPQPPAVASGLAEIKAHDPAFDEDAFLATAERCFFAVEEAWSQQRPELSQPVMSDEAWQRQKAEIESYRSSGRRGVLDNLTVAKTMIMAAGSQDGRDEVTVRFRAASANYDVEIASGKVVHGNHHMAFWEQEWVFERSSQISTGADSTEESRCPNCGAPLDLDIAGVCKNCKTAVRSSDGHWVVIRATQPQHVPS